MVIEQIRTPRDLGSANNPNRIALADDYLTTEEASSFLRERYRIQISPNTLIMRRSFGKAPKYLKGPGQAVRYRKIDLEEFARMAGIRGLDEPKVEKRPRRGDGK